MARSVPVSDRTRQMQRLSFAHGNLACSTNHKPSRKAFRAAALSTGTPEDVYDEWEATVTWERE